MSAGNSQLSKEFFDFVKAIGEAKTKQEEDRLLVSEVRLLRQSMSAKNVLPKRMKEYLIRMIYAEMLGHDASFGHINAINMVSSRNLLEKRVGYLAVSLTLHKDHEFLLLLVNALQTDLRSDNYLEVSMALNVVVKLVNPDIIPAVMPLVVQLLSHSQSLIRKKAVICLQRFVQLDRGIESTCSEYVRKALCDPDPCVMGASLVLLRELSLINPSAHKELVPSLVSILKQVIEHRLPREYDYHRIPAPWIQLDILRLFAVFGNADRRASEPMYDVISECIRRAAVGTNVGYAIVFECVRTTTQIYPNKVLLDACANAVEHFLSAEQGKAPTSALHNLKYLGLSLLASLIAHDPEYALKHQSVVVDCLEDPDETIRRKTIELLYCMTNGVNVTAIVERFIHALKQTPDVYLRLDLTNRISQLAERFAPSTEWFVTTMNTVFELSGDLVAPELLTSVLKLVAQGASSEDDDDATSEETESARRGAVDHYVCILRESTSISDLMMKAICWVLGEYGQVSELATVEEILQLLASSFTNTYHDSSVRRWVFSAITRLSVTLIRAARSVEVLPPPVIQTIRDAQVSSDCALQQSAHELQELLARPTLLASSFPIASYSTAVVVDESLPFLDSFVNAALTAGARPYMTEEERRASGDLTRSKDKKTSLRFDAYEKPQRAAPLPAAALPTATPVAAASISSATSSLTSISSPGSISAEESIKLRSGPKLWGPKGFNAPKATAAPVPAPAPQAATVDPVSTSTGSPSNALPVPMTNNPSLIVHVSNEEVANSAPISSTNSSSTVNFTPRKPEPKQVNSKNALFAKSLFAGLNTTATNTSVSASSSNANSIPFGSKSGIGSGKAAQPIASPAATPSLKSATPAASNDLLGLFSMNTPTSTSSTVPAASPANSTGSTDIFSLFTSPTSTTAAPAVASTQPSSSSSAFDLDIFSSLGAMDISSQTAKPSSDLSLGSITAAFANATQNHAQVGGTSSLSVAGGSISQSVYFSSANSIVALKIRLSQANSASFTIATPTGSCVGSISMISASGVTNGTSNTSGSYVISSSWKANEEIAIVLTISKASSNIFSTPFILSAQTSTGQALFRSELASLPVSGFIRPLTIQTKSYAESWKTVGSVCEFKSAPFATPSHMNVNAADPSAALAVVDRILKSLHIHSVQTIKLETIAAAVMVGSTITDDPVLVHVRTGETQTSLHVRSKDKNLSQNIASEFKVLFV